VKIDEPLLLFAPAATRELGERVAASLALPLVFKRADSFRESLARKLGRDVPIAFLEKKRSEGVVSGEEVAGQVDGRTVVLMEA
jgi:ribose-phosphate pyrophosphokinase